MSTPVPVSASAADAAEVRLIACLEDNYAVLVHRPDASGHGPGTTFLVDAPDEAPVLAALDAAGWTLDAILLTHHHGDHTGAAGALAADTGAALIGPAAEADKMPDLDIALEDGAVFRIGPFEVQAIATPGHTAGPLSYYLPAEKLAFTGDTLFALGCGRLFEGTAATLWASLRHLREVLPDDTRVYCGHEYTLSNARFALAVDPGNAALVKRAGAIEAARAAGRPTLPFLMGEEKATNPFLRADDPAVAASADLEGAAPAAVFAALRARKDSYR